MSAVPLVIGLTAAGTTQGTALALDPTKQFFNVSACAAGAGVQLPVGKAGSEVIIQNSAAAACLIYPQSTGVINSLAANVAYSLSVGATVSFLSSNGLSWSSTSTVAASSGSGINALSTMTVTATATLLPSNSGSTIFIPTAAAAITLSLPTVLTAGMFFDIMVSGTTLANAVTIAAGSAIIYGNSYANNATAVVGPSNTASSNIILTAAVRGDRVRLVSDGSLWLAHSGVTTNTVLTRS